MQDNYVFKCQWFVVLIFGLFMKTALAKIPDDFHYQISAIPPAIVTEMQKYTWRSGCPVPLSDLAYIRLNYWGFDHKPHMGNLIVHKKLAEEVVTIFAELYQNKFPIERMDLMDVFKGDDDAACAANNTSAFNCRAKTGQPGVFSLHSYGVAIDINPLQNPYVKDGKVLDKNAEKYIDRTYVAPGMILANDPTYQAFISKGWQWGGNWTSLKDYQHFEKAELGH